MDRAPVDASLLFHQKVDYSPKGCQGLVDVGGLLQVFARYPGVLLAFAACKEPVMQQADVLRDTTLQQEKDFTNGISTI